MHGHAEAATLHTLHLAKEHTAFTLCTGGMSVVCPHAYAHTGLIVLEQSGPSLHLYRISYLTTNCGEVYGKVLK